MGSMATEFEVNCSSHLDPFFRAHRDAALEDRAHRALNALAALRPMPKGKPAGWAAGIVHAVGSYGAGIPGVSNRELEAAFGVGMSEIYRFAGKVKAMLGTKLPSPWEPILGAEPFTVRDEANAMCAYAFRNTYLEQIHHENRITDEEMKRLMVQASESLARLLLRKQDFPSEYARFIRRYHGQFCRAWERSIPEPWPAENPPRADPEGPAMTGPGQP